MASGDVIASCLTHVPPTSAFATPDTTATGVLVYEFDDDTTETMQWLCYMGGGYDGTSNIKVILPWKFATFVGSQTCDWEVSFYRLADDADSIESFTYATAQTTLATEATATGEFDYASITFTNAQADGVQPNEYFMLKVVRDATGGTASPGDAQLIQPVVEQA